MRILVVGAGALGGYFGGRLLAAGRDVSFLVRPGRAGQIAQHGLRIVSQHGDADLRPRTVLAPEIGGPYDLILLAVKAYSLEAAMDGFAPAVGPVTSVIPLLNGIRHLDLLNARFGCDRVLGGLAFIAASLGPAGEVQQGMMPNHDLIFGEVAGGTSKRVDAIVSAFEGANFVHRASERIVAEMWEKCVAFSTNAAITCLMRAAIGDVLAAPGGRDTILSVFAECCETARTAGYEPSPKFVEMITGILTKEGSTLTASMLRDIERGGPTEGEHVFGDLVERAEQVRVSTPLLRLARCHVAAYEARKRREATIAAN
jgi:2-dehydropantoate 2-reductase